MSSRLSHLDGAWSRLPQTGTTEVTTAKRYQYRTPEVAIDGSFVPEPDPPEQLELQTKLVLGQVTFSAAVQQQTSQVIQTQLKVVLRVDGKPFALPVGIDINPGAADGVEVAFPVAIPITVVDGKLTVKVLGFTVAKTDTTYIGKFTVASGTTVQRYIVAEVTGLPPTEPPPLPTTARPIAERPPRQQPLRPTLCETDEMPDLMIGDIQMPTIPDMFLDCTLPELPELEIPDIEDPEFDFNFIPPLIEPPLIPVPPAPPGGGGGGGGGGGCTPNVTFSREKKQGCDRPADVQVYKHGECDVHVHYIFYDCTFDSNCCTFIWCDGEWQLYADDHNSVPDYSGDGMIEPIDGAPIIDSLKCIPTAEIGGQCCGEDRDTVHWLYALETLTHLPPCWIHVGSVVVPPDENSTVQEDVTYQVYEGCGLDGLFEIVEQLQDLNEGDGYPFFMEADGPFQPKSGETFNRTCDPPTCDCSPVATPGPTPSGECVDKTPTFPGRVEGEIVIICDCDADTPVDPCCEGDLWWLSSPQQWDNLEPCTVQVGTSVTEEGTAGTVTYYIYEGCGEASKQALIARHDDPENPFVIDQTNGDGAYSPPVDHVFTPTGTSPNCCDATSTPPPSQCPGTLWWFSTVQEITNSLPACWVLVGEAYNTETHTSHFVYQGCTNDVDGTDALVALLDNPEVEHDQGSGEYVVPTGFEFTSLAASPTCDEFYELPPS